MFRIVDRISRDFSLMAIALIMAKRSTCGRKQVGAVLARDGRILSTGYAGAPSGFSHCVPNICDLNKPCTRTVHAEANAIAFAARVGISTENSTLYTTASPCIDCAKLIINAGITRVLYNEAYRIMDGTYLLEDASITIQHFDIKPELDLLIPNDI